MMRHEQRSSLEILEAHARDGLARIISYSEMNKRALILVVKHTGQKFS